MLLDTSGLYCYLDADDAVHLNAVSLLNSSGRRVTHNYVLAELVALCNARRVNRRLALEFVYGLVNDPEIEVVWITQDEHRTAMKFLLARQDKSYSLCDAVSFQVMRQRGMTDALTTDRHFEQEGFIPLLRN
jgi:predicted nucleic acid-binding protein